MSLSISLLTSLSKRIRSRLTLFFFSSKDTSFQALQDDRCLFYLNNAHHLLKDDFNDQSKMHNLATQHLAEFFSLYVLIHQSVWLLMSLSSSWYTAQIHPKYNSSMDLNSRLFGSLSMNDGKLSWHHFCGHGSSHRPVEMSNVFISVFKCNWKDFLDIYNMIYSFPVKND